MKSVVVRPGEGSPGREHRVPRAQRGYAPLQPRDHHHPAAQRRPAAPLTQGRGRLLLHPRGRADLRRRGRGGRRRPRDVRARAAPGRAHVREPRRFGRSDGQHPRSGRVRSPDGSGLSQLTKYRPRERRKIVRAADPRTWDRVLSSRNVEVGTVSCARILAKRPLPGARPLSARNGVGGGSGRRLPRGHAPVGRVRFAAASVAARPSVP